MLMTSSMLVHETVATNVANRYTSAATNTLVTPYFLRLFSGPRPTKSQIRDLVTATTTEARYAMAKLPALLTRLGSEVVTSVGSGTTASLSVEWTPNKITIALSKLNGSATSLTDAPPTWGLVYLFPYTANANANSWEATMLAYFTVGPDETADLILPDGYIPVGTTWKSPDDLVLDITGVGIS